MVDTLALAGMIVSKGKTQKDVAEYLGISPKTFYTKMKKGVFGSDEMENIIDYLDMDMSAAVRIFLPRKSLNSD